VSRHQIRVAEVFDVAENFHRVLWTNGAHTFVTDDELAAIEAREAKFTPDPRSAA
jgi:hypothetical protein